MGAARAHHFISQCYLRGFTRNGSKKSKLCVASLAEQKMFECKPDGVAHRRDFNRVEGLAVDAVETMLSGFEGVVATALNRIGTDRSLENADAWEHVLNLAALFAVRHPAQRAQTTEAVEHTSRALLDAITRTPETWGAYVEKARADGRIPADTDYSYEWARELVQRGEFNIEVPTAKHIELELTVHGPVLETLKGRQWTLCVADPGAGNFITSDRPVVLTHSDGMFPSVRQRLGHGVGGTVVFFPINRELLAFGTFEGSTGVRHLDARNVALFNGITLSRAHREVYGPDRTDAVMIDGKMVTLAELPDVLRRNAQDRAVC